MLFWKLFMLFCLLTRRVQTQVRSLLSYESGSTQHAALCVFEFRRLSYSRGCMCHLIDSLGLRLGDESYFR